MVALSGHVEFPEMIERARVALFDPEAGGVAQPYHAAAEMDPNDAEEHIASSADSSMGIAREQLEALFLKLCAKNWGVRGARSCMPRGANLALSRAYWLRMP